MNKSDSKEEFVGCGGNCACAQANDEKKECAVPETGVALDKHGKCPCGKSAEDCCHADSIAGGSALGELCGEHNGLHICDTDSDLQKTGM